MAPGKSKYDEFYEIKNEKATCKRCGEIISCKGRSTKGMQSHLSSQHSLKPDDKIQDESESSAKKPRIEKAQTSISDHFKVTSKEPLEDLIAKEAVNGASFRYIAKSNLIKKGLCALGFQDQVPRHHYSVSRLVDKSAENHRLKLKEELKKLVENGQRFALVSDEWTCSGKRKKYINVTLHVKGNYLVISRK